MENGNLCAEDHVGQLIKQELRNLGCLVSLNFIHKKGAISDCGRSNNRDEPDFVPNADYDGFDRPVCMVESKTPFVEDATIVRRINQTRSYAVWIQGAFSQYIPQLIIYLATRAVKYETLDILNTTGANDLATLIPDESELAIGIRNVTKQYLE